MSIISEISRIEGVAASICTKVSNLGIAISSPSKLEDTYNAINTIASQAVSVSKLTADTSSVTISKGYYNANATIAVDVSTAQPVTLTSSSQTISCDNKMMDGNIIIPAANVFYTGESVPSNTEGNEGDLFLITLS